MAQQAAVKTAFTFDERIDDATRDYLRSRNDAFASALPSAGTLHWTFVEDTTGRRYYRLRKNSHPQACYMELTLDEIQALDERDIDRIIKHNECPCIDVNARLDRWIERLNELYDTIGKWCTEALLGCRLERGRVSQHEEPIMRLRRAAPRDIPTLTIEFQGKATKIVPRALFVVGANGIVDVLTPARHYTLFDLAPDEAAARDWKITDESKEILRPLTRSLLPLIVKRGA